MATRPKLNFQYIVDTREQNPLNITPHIKSTLRTGDYSISGFEKHITVERKSIDDLVSSLLPDSNNCNRGWLRFKKEITRMRAMKRACIVVEADWNRVLFGEYYSKANPASIVGLIMRVMVDFDIPIYFTGDRASAAVFVEKWLQRSAVWCMSQEDIEIDKGAL